MDNDFDDLFDINRVPDMPEHQLKYCQALHEVFELTELGRDLLELWEKSYLYSPNVPPLQDALSYPDWYPYVREGENRFIRTILTDLKRYKQYKEKKYDRSSSSESRSTRSVNIDR